MDYEIQRKLNEKVDEVRFHGLQTENRELRNHVNELGKKIGQLESTNIRICCSLEGLFNLISEHPQFSELQNEVFELRRNLY